VPFEGPQRLLVGNACHEYLEGLGVVAERIPDVRRLNDVLDRTTGCRFRAVPGLVPAPIYREIAAMPDLEPGTRFDQDREFRFRGRQKNWAAQQRGPSLGRKRLEDVRYDHNR
jgi:hypothetical protein